MRLDGPTDSLELRLVSYQFAHAAEWWDANWLVVEIGAQLNGRRWRAHDAALLTVDVAEMADWLGRVATGRDVPETIDFTEPCLALTVDQGAAGPPTLYVDLAHEFSPPWLEGEARLDGVRLHLDLDRVVLLDAASSLRQQLAGFPPRGERTQANE